jgi:hypothetical protein
VVITGKLVVSGGRHVLIAADGLGLNVPERLVRAVARAWGEA